MGIAVMTTSDRPVDDSGVAGSCAGMTPSNSPALQQEQTADIPVSESDTHPVDTRPQWRQLVPMSIQHLLVMIATPISSVFLISATLELDASTTRALLCATLLACGVGTLLQSMGWLGLGARLPFVMLPGGAAVVLFLQIAHTSGAATATGAVIVTGLVGIALSPFAGRLVRFVPPVVIAAMIVVIGINLVKVSGGLIVGAKGTTAPMWAVGLAAVTVASIVVLHRLLPAPLNRISVLAGMAVGTAVSALTGHLHLDAGHQAIQVPSVFPFGTPHFDILATIPLLVFSIGSMAEATGQVVLNADVVGKRIDSGATVGRAIRGDAVTSVFAGVFGGQTMVTSGENIGIVRTTGVRSRYVSTGTGVLLLLMAFVAPVGAIINSLPAPVVGATAAYVFAMIIVTGLKMFTAIDMSADRNFVTAVAALTAGLLPVVAPGLYGAFPSTPRLLLSSGVTMAALVGIVVAALYARRPRSPLSR